MAENESKQIPYIPILPKPNAKFVFVGRDPSPNTAKIVGIHGGKSVFINEIFRLCDEAKIPDEEIYITDLCKCHWRTSVGTPSPGTEDRNTKLDKDIAQKCFETWLVCEIEFLAPKLIVAFGEEIYQLLRPYIITPSSPPKRLSARRDKTQLDAEMWYVDNGCMEILIGGSRWPLAVLRHPGNSSRLPKGAKGDYRAEYHHRATERIIDYLMSDHLTNHLTGRGIHAG